MIPNVKPSILYAVAGAIPAQSVAKNTAKDTGWVAIPAGSRWAKITLNVGSAGSAVVVVDTQQAKTSGGGSSKALLSAVITTDGTDNKTYEFDVELDQNLDINNGFTFLKVLATTDNVAAGPTLLGLTVFFGPTRFAA